MRWPAGIRSAGVAAGIKGDSALDVGVLVLDRPCDWAGTFTRNAAAAAPVLWSQAKLGGPARALIVNSGNANACTGTSGVAAVDAEVTAVARALGCDTDEVLVAATGPIGVPPPVAQIVDAVPAAIAGINDAVDDFAASILTTDTTTKTARATTGANTVVGVAKGAAMLAPNMATMLAFVATDAAVDAATLQKILDVAVERSFNRITVDACESTNDSVFMFATGTSGEADVDGLLEATTAVCRELAHAMVRDAEGGSRVVRISVEGAPSESRACELARSVAGSALWRAAVYGADPNWGRIAAALGSVEGSLDLAALTITIGACPVFEAGEPATDMGPARAAMQSDEIVVRCSVGTGPGAAEFLTSDLTPDYVVLNAGGTT